MDTMTLASIFGPLFLVAGLGAFANQKVYDNVLKDFTKTPALMYLAGLVLLGLGVLIVRDHTVWELSEAGLITLVAWAALLKGALFLLAPSTAVDMMKNCKNFVKVGGAIGVLVGAYLTYGAYFAQAAAEVVEVVEPVL